MSSSNFRFKVSQTSFFVSPLFSFIFRRERRGQQLLSQAREALRLIGGISDSQGSRLTQLRQKESILKNVTIKKEGKCIFLNIIEAAFINSCQTATHLF
jgi:hypothetical protein